MPIALAAVLLTARFYTLVDVPAGDRSTATRVAANILRAAGIAVAFIDCTETRTAAPACLTPVGPNEVIVRFVGAPTPTPNRRASADSLGDAYVDTTAATGTLATVYVDRAAWMARIAGIDAATVLGRVMAHEIGHLLLGTSVHRPFGLMRAQWSAAMLQRRMASDWRLSKVDAASARAGLVRRAQPLQAAAPVVVPCSTPVIERAGVVCSSCPVCVPRLPTDRVALHLLVEPGF